MLVFLAEPVSMSRIRFWLQRFMGSPACSGEEKEQWLRKCVKVAVY